ncbi:MAG TPA: xanthine dehydrogenase family protein molybdopterin-binding subunit [Stellaceae bacterium]|nr:xanthine dehydrogenase family protein molybdopterin-binding subunit [Stellaceae bacterium]
MTHQFPSRRAFLAATAATAGAFVLATFVPFPGRALAQGGPPPGPYDPNLFIRIGADNTVTVVVKHLEMGQGVSTGIPTVVAEELDADWADVRFEFSSNDTAHYNNLFFGPAMGTGGSTSINESFDQMRKAGAAARAMLVAATASEWKVPAGEITVASGVVAHPGSGHKARFGELAAAAMQLPVPTEVTLKPVSSFKLIGTRLPRLDSVGKTTGRAQFALDIRRPGMLTAVVRRPDHFGAAVATLDDAAARKVAGVVDVIRIPSGVAVLATDTWAATRGREALKIEWDLSKAERRSTAEILAEYGRLADQPGMSAIKRGDAAAGLGRAVKTIDAEFAFPYLAHAPMEPMNCVLEVKGGKAEMWAGSQLQTLDTFVLAKILGLKPENVAVHTTLGGGSFGRRANPQGDWASEAAAIVKAIGGKAPVHLVWTREDDIKGGFYRPLSFHRVKAGIDAQGRITGWRHTVVSKSILIGTPFEKMGIKDGVDSASVEGIVDTSYAIGDMSVELHNPASPVPVLWWRSVGHSHTGHVMETALDELAHLAGKDPLDFRLALLAAKPREQAVLKLAADKSGWGSPMPKGRGRGIAYHESFGTRVAMVAEVAAGDTDFKVERIVAAVDCGIAVNPDVIAAQLEGAVGFALSAVLRNKVTLKNGVVEQGNFDDYEPTRIGEMPRVEVHIVPSAEHPSGVGEPGVPPLAPAIGNALFAATGKRVRSLPMELGRTA